MIRCLENKAIDKPKWDALIAECGNIYAYSWYLDIAHPGWDALVDDDYQAVMPLTGGKKFGVNYLFQPFFVQQLGVFSKTPMTEGKLNDFLDAIPDKYRFCELRLNESNTLDNDIEEFDYHHICANYCHDIVRDQLIKKGYKYDQQKGRFKNEKIREKAYKMATDIWHQDLMIMYEAFQDIVEENDDWENWTKKFDAEAKALNKKLDKLKILKEKKELWESIVEYMPYNPSTCRFRSVYISHKIRKDGLKLFGEHFQELWW